MYKRQVNVLVEGTTSGAITDLDGNFTIEAPVGSTLSITYVGYAPQTVKVGVQNTDVYKRQDRRRYPCCYSCQEN